MISCCDWSQSVKWSVMSKHLEWLTSQHVKQWIWCMTGTDTNANSTPSLTLLFYYLRFTSILTIFSLKSMSDYIM